MLIRICCLLMSAFLLSNAQYQEVGPTAHDNTDIDNLPDVDNLPHGNPEGKSLENDNVEQEDEREQAQDSLSDDTNNEENEENRALNADGIVADNADLDNTDLREGSSSLKKQKKKDFVYVPVPLKKKKKKDKIVAIAVGMYIPGGQPIFGKYKSLKHCAAACSKNPTCFAADYDKWLFKCYMHTNVTACASQQAHPSITHLSKVPCFRSQLPTTNSRVILGAQMFYGFEQKGIEDIKSCIKKCTSMGGGIATLVNTMATVPQLCAAINFDFSSHKCYVYPPVVNGLRLCAYNTGDLSAAPSVIARFVPRISSRLLVANPFVVTMFICPTTITQGAR